MARRNKGGKIWPYILLVAIGISIAGSAIRFLGENPAVIVGLAIIFIIAIVSICFVRMRENKNRDITSNETDDLQQSQLTDEEQGVLVDDLVALEDEKKVWLAEREKLVSENAELRTTNDLLMKKYGKVDDLVTLAENSKVVAKAMQNIIEGYGDEYLIPAYSLLDELAEEFAYTNAAEELKAARTRTKHLIKTGQAADCDYVEDYRRNTAISFVVDAFNGKVDSILSKSKTDNYGKLQQQIKDAAILVNKNGGAFRNAHIKAEYIEARLMELKWAVAVKEIQKQYQEEQREIRERMREEARAQREFERALKEAAKEQEYYEKAMDKARAELAQASEEQKEKLNGKILDLEAKLKEAEEKNQRALSMAQQTRAGNVYVISNIGAFGENVYKIGMTRRLEPLDRVRELGDASVPFPFDVHGMIYSEDAPALEKELHRAFMHGQMNKVNSRKEFFKASITDIRALVEKKGFSVSWTLEAVAAEYRETMEIEKRIATDPTVRAEWETHMDKAIEEDSGEENQTDVMDEAI